MPQIGNIVVIHILPGIQAKIFLPEIIPANREGLLESGGVFPLPVKYVMVMTNPGVSRQHGPVA